MPRPPATHRAGSLPLQAVMTFHALVFSLFLFWPINWPIYSAGHWALLIAYVLACYFALGAMFLTGARGSPAPGASRPPVLLIYAGAALAVVLLVPISYAYTGLGPWNVMEALQRQGEVYREFNEQLLLTSGQRGPVALARAFTWPLTFAVLPLGIVHWRSIGWIARGAVLATAACSIVFSILRGTDREIAELVIVVAAAFFVSMGRNAALRASIAAIFARLWKPALVLSVMLVVGASLFTERKAERLGQIQVACANDSQICADLDAPGIAWLDDRAKFSASLFILSSASGYYGLALGLEKEFEPTYGAGHSAFALSLYELLTGDPSLKARTFTYRNEFDGWNPDNYWSTAILWFANDVGFIGAIVVMALIGLLWGRSWRDATVARNDAAAVIFCLVMVGVVQIASTNAALNALEGYVALAFWGLVWRFTRARPARAPLPAPRAMAAGRA